jgi:hypothetical protein
LEEETNLLAIPNSQYINTLFLKTLIDGYMKEFVQLFSEKYYSDKENNLKLGGRYVDGLSGSVVDSSSKMITYYDETSKQLLGNINSLLENIVDQQINKQEYSQNIIIPSMIEE